MSAAVRVGYKQTEVGVIPEKWESITFEKACLPSGLVRGPFGGSLTKSMFVREGKKVYEQRNAIYRDESIGRYFITDAKYSELKRFSVAAGEFIVSCSGTIGRIFKIPVGAVPGVINQALLKIQTDTNVVDPDYFFYYFDWDIFQKKIVDNTHGGAMMNLVGMSVFRNIEIARPPLPEQRAIATALSDVDALLAKLDALIAKKRDLKVAAVQQLLTGQTRLPGFKGEWKVKRLGDVASFHKGKGLPKSSLTPSGSEPCIHYGELFTRYPETIGEIINRTNDSRDSFRSIANDVLMPTSDVTPRGLAKASCVRVDDVILGGDILIIRSDRKCVYGPFLSYVIRREEGQVLQLVSGSTVFHLYGSDMKKFSFLMPNIVEQTAIATVLSDMDTELTSLEARRDKTRAIKQGKMQELLTGRIRLV